MYTKTQHGFLFLADISGFTSYLARVELDHAHEILTELLETIVEQFKSILTISKLEGDAVFAYVVESRVSRGETLLELIESTYVSFRDGVETARRRTTCTCRACQAIPMLDLKFIVHHGDFIIQTVSGIRELVGSDVNLAHRLMKNHIAEATGWKAYALFTDKVMEHLGVTPEGLFASRETYEHLGDVQTYSLDLRPRYEARVAARREYLSPDEAHVITRQDYPVAPPVVWDWLNDPVKRGMYAPEEGLKFTPVVLPGGRTGVGARTHCVHGKKVAVVETVLDWRPFDYYTIEQDLPGPLYVRATFQLKPLPDGGTRLEIYERGKTTKVEALDRMLYRFLFTKMMPTSRIFAKMGQLIEEDRARQADQPGQTAAALAPEETA